MAINRFEYKVVCPKKSMTAEELGKFLNDYGEFGWELCYVNDYCAVFKRNAQ